MQTFQFLRTISVTQIHDSVFGISLTQM
uniref:Uncharacterized protein n=1 Tax=Anguilla anguilla TaxID=7936 RepID=A0A0E9R588_ANGAN